MEKLPIKTKIAAWILLIMGIIVGSPVLYYTFFYHSGSGCYGCLLLFILFDCVMLIISLLFFLSGIFLLKRKRKAWWLSIIISPAALVFSLTDFIGTINEIKNAVSITAGKPWIEEPLFLIFILEFIIIILFPISLILLLLDRKNFWKIAS